MKRDSSIILSKRLELIPLPVAFLQLSLDRNYAAAERLLGLSIPADWFEEQRWIRRRLEQLSMTRASNPGCSGQSAYGRSDRWSGILASIPGQGRRIYGILRPMALSMDIRYTARFEGKAMPGKLVKH
jgi:hypothetical protein